MKKYDQEIIAGLMGARKTFDWLALWVAENVPPWWRDESGNLECGDVRTQAMTLQNGQYHE